MVLAIIFSVIMPAFFYIASMNTLYDKIMKEMINFDDQRSLESIRTWIWPNEIGNVTINIENTCPYAIGIARIWVVPSNPLYEAQGFTPQKKQIGPKEFVSISDTNFNNYIRNLTNTTYYVKIVTTKGNMFYTPPLAPGFIGEYYKYPLIILKTSVFTEVKQNQWEFSLHIFNKGNVFFSVDYIVITEIYVGGGGTPLQVNILDENSHPGILPVDFPPNEITNTDVLDFRSQSQSDVFLVELIGSMKKTGSDEKVSGYILGAYYYIRQ